VWFDGCMVTPAATSFCSNWLKRYSSRVVQPPVTTVSMPGPTVKPLNAVSREENDEPGRNALAVPWTLSWLYHPAA